MSKVCQLFSGSSGNSIYIENGNTSFLVDAGVSAKRIESALNGIGASASKLNAVFVTHEHSDHIKGVRVLCSKYGIPVYTNRNTLYEMDQHEVLNNKYVADVLENQMEFDDFCVKTFELSHDSKGCNGFRFDMSDGRSISVCTDTGYITDEAKAILPGSDLVVIESNHEVRMVENGPYPYILKRRILSEKGHLSNTSCGEFAKELVNSGTTRIVLAHLSKENNVPEIALETTKSALTDIGASLNSDYRLRVSKTENNERPIVL